MIGLLLIQQRPLHETKAPQRLKKNPMETKTCKEVLILLSDDNLIKVDSCKLETTLQKRSKEQNSEVDLQNSTSIVLRKTFSVPFSIRSHGVYQLVQRHVTIPLSKLDRRCQIQSNCLDCGAHHYESNWCRQ